MGTRNCADINQGTISGGSLFPSLFFLWLLLWHMEVLQLGVESQLQLPAYATATPDLSLALDLHHSSWQCQILNPMSEARDRTCILMDTNWVHYHWATTGTPKQTHLITEALGLEVYSI